MSDMTENEFAKFQKDFEQRVKDIHQNKAQILEDFAKAYIAETGLMPSEIVMVHSWDKPSWKEVIYFRKRIKSEE